MTVLALVDMGSPTLESSIARELKRLARAAEREIDVFDLAKHRDAGPMETGRRLLGAVAEARMQSQHLMLVGDDLHDYVHSLLLSVSEVLFLGWAGGSPDQCPIRACLGRLEHVAGGMRDRQVFVISESQSFTTPASFEISANVTLLMVPCRELGAEDLGQLHATLRLF